MKILFGYDGSECADAALEELGRAGLPDAGELYLLSVAETWLPPPPPSAYEVLEEARDAESPAELQREFSKLSNAAKEALALARAAQDRLKLILPGWTISVESVCGSPAWELMAKADEWKPDLIVVGSHGRTALGRLVLGSVSQRVLNEGRCSVRIARGSASDLEAPLRIMVAVDGSPISLEALKVVAQRHWPPQTKVKIVMVVDPLLPSYLGIIPPIGRWLEEDRQADHTWLHGLIKESVDALQAAKIATTYEVRDGDAKRELLKVAEEWKADCIFLGAIGFSNRIERFVLGSISGAIAVRAHCSVEVVRKQL